MNMDRSLKTWESIWPIVYNNIIFMIKKLSGGEMQDLADMGLDTLRQLSSKMLVKSKNAAHSNI
jgi:hypothetical protein